MLALSLGLTSPTNAQPSAGAGAGAGVGIGDGAGVGAGIGDGRGGGVPTLTGFASLPALTFVPASEPSGSLLGTAPINGVTPPFADQPVQGFSGVVRRGEGVYETLSDNGYGAKNNSADFMLCITGSRQCWRPRGPPAARWAPAVWTCWAAST